MFWHVIQISIVTFWMKMKVKPIKDWSNIYLHIPTVLFKQMTHTPLHPWFKDVSEMFLEFILPTLT